MQRCVPNVALDMRLNTANTSWINADVADCLKDLQRFLREDDPKTREAFFTLGRYKSVRTDLVPLITTYAADTDIVYNARVLPCLALPLTMIAPFYCLTRFAV